MSEEEDDIKENIEKEKEKEPSVIKEKKDINIQDFYRCPKCNEIPFIKINKINCSITTECNNNHIFENIPIEQFISDLKKENENKNNEKEKDKLNYSLCVEHQEKYINYCKTCKKNLCMYCDYTKHESHDIKIFFPIISDLELKIKESKLKMQYLEEFIDSVEKMRNEINENILKFETFLKNSLLLNKMSTMNIDIKNINYQIIQNFYELNEYKNENTLFKEFISTKNILRRGKILLKILNSYENDSNEKKEEKKELINNIEIKSTIKQSAYPFNYFSLKNDGNEDNLIGLVSDEMVKIYSISKNDLSMEMQEKLIINESKNINYLTTLEITNNKNKNINNIIICIDNFFKIIEILIEENNIIGYEEKIILNLNDTVRKIITYPNKLCACDKKSINIYDNNIDNSKNDNDDAWYNFKKINEIKVEEGNSIYDIISINQNEIASVQNNEKIEDKIFIFFYSINDCKSIKNIEIDINKNIIKENENGNINCSSLLINKDVFGISLMNILFLISIQNKELIKTIVFDGELYFIEKYINDSFILNRKVKNNNDNDINKEKSTSILYQYKIGKENELEQIGQNDEMANLSEFKYFDEYKLGISTSYDNNIISVWN